MIYGRMLTWLAWRWTDTPAVEQRERREAGRCVERRRTAAAAHARRVAQAPAVEAGRGPGGDGRVHAVLLAQQAHQGAPLSEYEQQEGGSQSAQ